MDHDAMTVEIAAKVSIEMRRIISAIDQQIDAYEELTILQPHLKDDYKDFTEILMEAQRSFGEVLAANYSYLRSIDLLLKENNDVG